MIMDFKRDKPTLGSCLLCMIGTEYKTSCLLNMSARFVTSAPLMSAVC